MSKDPNDVPIDDALGDAEVAGHSEDVAEAAEAAADMGGDEGGDGEPGGLSDDELISDAQADQRRTRASWHLLSKEVFTLLFANCLFFAGSLASWSRGVPEQVLDPAHRVWGLETIRGTFIFALSIYGFWTAVFNIWHRQMKIKPYLWNAILALWVGIEGITSSIGGERWDKTIDLLKVKYPKTVFHEITYRLGVIPAGQWLLTIGGAIVLVTLIRGIIAGAQSSKATAAAAAAAAQEARRRRRGE